MIFFYTFASETERDKFEWIYQKYKNLLFHKAYAILGDTMLAEDAVSEAFLRIYKNMHKIGDPASAGCAAFVVTIVKNTSLTLLRKQKRDVPESFDDDRKDSFDLEEHVVSQISAERIYALMESLNEELRSVFLLSYAYHLSHREIAKLLRITENNVTVRLHRARKKLAALLVKEGYAVE